MVREDILGGLNLAVQKGIPLKQAMITFYNAGYEKEDIEEAARIFVQSQYNPMQQPASQPAPSALVSSIPKKTQPITQFPRGQPIQKVSNYIPQPLASQNKYSQKISLYSRQKNKQSGKILMIILMFVFIILAGLAISAFLFKDQITQLLNDLF